MLLANDVVRVLLVSAPGRYMRADRGVEYESRRPQLVRK